MAGDGAPGKEPERKREREVFGSKRLGFVVV